MPRIMNAEVRWVKCDPKNPVRNYNEDGYEWSLMLLTNDPATAKSWADEHHLTVKRKKPKEGEKATGDEPFVTYLRKLAYRDDEGKDACRPAPSCVAADLSPLNPNIVGNGSLANIQVRYREWSYKKKSGVTADLIGIQVIDLHPYVPVEEEFEATEMKVTERARGDDGNDEDDDDDSVY